MKRRVLGRSGLWVSLLGPETGAFGDAAEDDCIRMAHCAPDASATLVDAAGFHSFDEPGRTVGKGLKGRRPQPTPAGRGAPAEAILRMFEKREDSPAPP